MAENIGDLVWFRPDNSSLLSKFMTKVLKQGPLPKHVSCILDGNRTWSMAKGIDNIEGYVAGVHVLIDTMNWALLYGIEEMSAYIFSLENFKRDPEEVMRLFELFKNMAVSLYEHIHEFHARGISVRFIGDWSRFPPPLTPLFAQIMLETRGNEKSRFNLAFAYTGRNEITRGVQQIWKAINENRLSVADLSVPLLDQVICISSAKNPVDLLMRTSGCTRLSDYMMWQSTEAVLNFIPTLWPDYTLWDFQKSIFFYQRQKMAMQKLKLPKKPELDLERVAGQVKVFLRDVQDVYLAMLKKSAKRFRLASYKTRADAD